MKKRYIFLTIGIFILFLMILGGINKSKLDKDTSIGPTLGDEEANDTTEGLDQKEEIDYAKIIEDLKKKDPNIKLTEEELQKILEKVSLINSINFSELSIVNDEEYQKMLEDIENQISGIPPITIPTPTENDTIPEEETEEETEEEEEEEIPPSNVN